MGGGGIGCRAVGGGGGIGQEGGMDWIIRLSERVHPVYLTW